MSGAKVLGIKKKAVTFVSWEKRIDFLNFIFFKWVNNKFDYVTQVDIKQPFENVTNHNFSFIVIRYFSSLTKYNEVISRGWHYSDCYFRYVYESLRQGCFV